MPKGKRRGNGEGSVYLCKDGRYAGYIRTEKGKKQYFYGRCYQPACCPISRSLALLSL